MISVLWGVLSSQVRSPYLEPREGVINSEIDTDLQLLYGVSPGPIVDERAGRSGLVSPVV